MAVGGGRNEGAKGPSAARGQRALRRLALKEKRRGGVGKGRGGLSSREKSPPLLLLVLLLMPLLWGQAKGEGAAAVLLWGVVGAAARFSVS